MLLAAIKLLKDILCGGNVKKILSSALLLAAAVGVSDAVAEDKIKFSLEPEVGFYTDYVYRGQNLYNGTSIQPEATLAAETEDMGTFSANVWSHVSAEDDRTDEQFTRINYTLDYTLKLDMLSLSVGHLWYTHESNNVGLVDTAEYYAGMSLDTLLNPTFTYFRDYDEIDTNYFELTLSHKMEDTCGMGDGFNLTPYVTFGFTDENNVVYADNGLVQWTVGMSSDMKLGNLDVTPSFHYTVEEDDNADNQFWFGVTIGRLFEL